MRVLLSAFGILLSTASARADSPNIVLILADDLGHADTSLVEGSDVSMPHLDRLAAEGITFTQAYAMGAECTPSRTALLTGRYAQRQLGLECAIGTGNVGRYDDAIALAEQGQLGLKSESATLAPLLQSAGYRTAIFGKWHLGYEPHFSPLKQGFDEFVGFLGGNVEYFEHFELSDIPAYVSGTEPIEREGYLTDLITEDALAFLDRTSAGETPFFLYLPHAAPHFPFQAPEDGDKPTPTSKTWTDGTRDTYRKMLLSLDQAIGAVLQKLDELSLAENTIVIFASDHGAMKPGSNAPFRDYKGTLFEGGIRVPLAIRWPSRISAGEIRNEPVTLMDLNPTLLNAAEALPEAYHSDGLDLLDPAAPIPAQRDLFWRARRGDRTWRAARSGDWKYVSKQESGETETWLFELGKDPTESANLIDSEIGQATE
ncbi:MAG: sulfatase-like hydrolase/transferase, partial [Verrucomicrobiota bacterium]